MEHNDAAPHPPHPFRPARARGGLLLARLFGAPWIAALLGVAGGALAFALWRVPEEEGAAASAAPPAAEESDLPPAREVMSGFDDPLLLLRGRKVLLANPAARALLGDHIENGDVRLAIRHPAAAELLVAEDEASGAIQLEGLGDPDRRWEMTTARLADGSRLVRLTDRSRIHAAEQMRVDFVANAGHELRTPLATLLGFLETLQDEEAGGDPKTRARFLNVMFGEATRMRTLLDDLMSLSRVQADRFVMPNDPVDLLPLIEEARAGLAQLAAQHGSAIHVEPNAGRQWCSATGHNLRSS